MNKFKSTVAFFTKQYYFLETHLLAAASADGDEVPHECEDLRNYNFILIN